VRLSVAPLNIMKTDRDQRIRVPKLLLHVLLGSMLLAGSSAAMSETDDILIRNGEIFDGSGNASDTGDVAIDGDRILYVGRRAGLHGRTQIEAKGQAVAPGFVNMLAHPEESLLADGRALSDLRQGVTLEVMGEDSMGPLTPAMKARLRERQADIHYDVDWTTLGEYLQKLQTRGIAPNVASFVGAGTVRVNVVGERDVQPTPEELIQMRTLVRHAMEEGALGVTTALIYSPNGYAKTLELMALAGEYARCGGIYIAHMRRRFQNPRATRVDRGWPRARTAVGRPRRNSEDPAMFRKQCEPAATPRQ
jgi:N-acyl-D-amino-acid deacylase